MKIASYSTFSSKFLFLVGAWCINSNYKQCCPPSKLWFVNFKMQTCALYCPTFQAWCSTTIRNNTDCTFSRRSENDGVKTQTGRLKLADFTILNSYVLIPPDEVKRSLADCSDSYLIYQKTGGKKTQTFCIILWIRWLCNS